MGKYQEVTRVIREPGFGEANELNKQDMKTDTCMTDAVESCSVTNPDQMKASGSSSDGFQVVVEPVEDGVRDSELVEDDGDALEKERGNADTDSVDGIVCVERKITCKNVGLVGLIAPDGVSVVTQDSDQVHEGKDATDQSKTAGHVIRLLIEKSKTTVLVINGRTKFCHITTNRYRSDKQVLKQHYISNVKGEVDGDIGLAPLDELLKVNGQSLQNLPQRKVIQIFKDIRMRKKDSTLDLNMHVRRWVKDPESTDEDPVWTEVQEINIKLVLVPEEQGTKKKRRFRDVVKRVTGQKYRSSNRLSVKDLSEQTVSQDDLPRGNVRVDSEDEAFKSHIQICSKPGEYVIWDPDGLVQPNVITPQTESSAEFMIEPFKGDDMGPKPVTLHVYGVRCYYQKAGAKWFIHYDNNDFDVSCKAFPDDTINTQDIDERCFLVRKIGSRMLLQSAVDRDRFVSIDPVTNCFAMKEIDVSSLIAIMEGHAEKQTDFNYCWFEFQNFEEETSVHHTIFDSVLNVFACGPIRSHQLST